MTITHPLARLAALFLSRYVSHLWLCGIFGIHVVLQPFGRDPCNPRNARQRHALQQQAIDQGFGFFTDRLPYRMFHELPTTRLTGELRFSVVDVTVLDNLIRSAPWAGWHSFIRSFHRP